MNKTLSKEILKRSNLRNEYLKSRSEEHRQRFVKQRNLCISTKKDKKKLLFELKRKSKILENGKANAFKLLCQ